MFGSVGLRSAPFTWITTIMRGAREQQIFKLRCFENISKMKFTCSLKLEYFLMAGIDFADNVAFVVIEMTPCFIFDCLAYTSR